MAIKSKVTEIAKSWDRCTNEYHLGHGQDIKPERLTESELRIEQEAFNENFHLAIPIFDELFKIGKQNNFRVHAANKHGTILVEDGIYAESISDYDLSIGSILNEEYIGTNGAGTTLMAGKALTVFADEHFSKAFHNVACTAAPLISPFGEVAGTINISSYAKSSKNEHNDALKLVNDAASQIEATIFRATYDEYHLISIVHQEHKAGERPNSLLAVNDSGWIIGATTLTQQILGIEDTGLIIGQGIKDILGYSLDDLHKHHSLALFTKENVPSHWQVRLSKKDSWNASINHAIKMTQEEKSPLYKVAGSDPHLKRNADICTKLINKRINMLLIGETGTGKEVWARAIHNSSHRCDKPFITLNCAAIPESLIESELFGYSAGTFTGGLKKGKVGKIEASHGGTLFLDEIGDMPLKLQARLLRVLAENEVTPLGQLEPIKVDFNVICATHRDLMQHVNDGTFREDLYYRISGVSITLSALRERSDRNEIIKNILRDVSGNDEMTADHYAMTILNKYHWPGNIRQLKNALHFAVSMCNGSVIRITDLPEEVFKSQSTKRFGKGNITPYPLGSFPSSIEPDTEANLAQSSEKEQILAALEKHRWVISKAAETLGISRSTLHRKIKTYKLK